MDHTDRKRQRLSPDDEAVSIKREYSERKQYTTPGPSEEMAAIVESPPIYIVNSGNTSGDDTDVASTSTDSNIDQENGFNRVIIPGEFMQIFISGVQ